MYSKKGERYVERKKGKGGLGEVYSLPPLCLLLSLKFFNFLNFFWERGRGRVLIDC
jgi:hypothetical protein